MLKDITLGQYLPGNTPVHKLDPRTKIIIVFVYIIALFMADGPIAYALSALWLISMILVSKIGLNMVLKSIRPLLFILIFTAALNVLYTPGRILWQYGFLKITYEGISLAVYMMLRIVMLIVGTSLLTYTTSPIMLTDGIETLAGPLKRFKVPVHELAMMMTIALRFIPTLIEETEKIMNAQKARGADFESGSLIQRARAMIPILIPLFISAFRRADELAVAMECRLYRGGEGRTRLKVLKYRLRDVLALIVTGAAAALIYAAGKFPI